MSDKRPKLLFLAWPFPPARAIACVRTWNISKYLARLGWDVTVVTPHPSVWKHVDDPGEVDANLKREGIWRIVTGHRWRCLRPDHLNCWNQGLGWLVGGVCRKIACRLGLESEIGWIKAAERACSTLTLNDVDVILATGSPFASFSLAKRLSDKLGRPYVLDYRDPWTGNPHAAHLTRPAVVQKEAKLLAGCAAVTIVSPSWASAMNLRFGLGSKLHVVTNGYDAEELADVRPYDFGHRAIVYAGNFYPPKRVISPVMAALKRLEESMNGEDTDWYFHYYGGQGHHVREEAERAGVIERRIILHGEFPRAEALSAVQGASVAVVVTSVAEKATTEDQGIVPAKVFETLGLGTPILVVAPPGSDIEAVVEAAGSARSFTASDIDGMVSFLTEAIHGRVSEPRDREAYEWTNIVKKMDHILCAAVRAPNKTASASVSR